LIRFNGLVGAAVITSTALLALMPGTPALAQSSQSGQTTWTVTPGATSGIGVLRSVYAASPTDAVAVGSQNNSSSRGFSQLIEQWNGSDWQVASVPSVSQFSNQLLAVSGDSATDIWAVGDVETTNGSGGYPPENTLVMHYNGSSWTRVSSPSPGAGGTSGRLTSVEAFGPDDVWASGFFPASSNAAPTDFTLQWNGTSWSEVTLPDPTMQVVGGTSSTDVWFMSSTAAWHYNGSTFTQVSGPASHAITAISPTDAWGESSTSAGTELNHYNGTSWSTVTTLPSSDGLFTLAALSSTDVWAVGEQSLSNGDEQTLTVNWNGSTWNTVPSPDPAGSSFPDLIGVAAASPSTVFAVGQGGGTGGDGTLALVSSNG
jgi:hypothetical protein